MMQYVDFSNQEWNDAMRELPGTHILQSWEWGEIKRKYGWKVNRVTWSDGKNKINAAAQILERSIRPLKIGPQLKVLYVPRGPMLDWRNVDLRKEVLSDLVRIAVDKKAIFIKIDPEVIINKVEGIIIDSSQTLEENGLDLIKDFGWKYSPEQIQFKNTLWIGLLPSEDDLLKTMKQKTRYNIHLAQRKGVKISRVSESDFPVLYKLYAQTSDRDGFIIRPKEYYFDLWGTLFKHNMAEGFIAEFEGIPLAGLILFYFAKKAWYFYGMSSEIYREKMPNYLLQWEAIQSSKTLGCEVYDLWGAPDEINEKDQLLGVYKFKLGLGGKYIKTIGAWDFPIYKTGYLLYHFLLPRILSIYRKIRRRQIYDEIAG